MRHAAPATHTTSCKMYAAISEDVPPQIYEVAFYREHLTRKDLRHIPVMVFPDVRNARHGVQALRLKDRRWANGTRTDGKQNSSE